MEWTEKDRKALLAFRDIIDSDNIRIKQIIKEKLLNNRFIIHTLNNKELEDSDAEPDEYFGKNILDYYMINPTQYNIENYVCFTTNFDELERYNKQLKYMEITFSILCHNKSITDIDTGISRHDLLGALILDEFNWTNYFGTTIHCVSDKESVVDTDYAARIIVFQQITDNNLVKTREGSPRLINKEIHY